ncbi:hypothetical protein C8R44DRAFT_16359 [Mycena epipterygia]|nr:hypothetical protein C8R44DRAFT_16359 [Mycena epipterygia]
MDPAPPSSPPNLLSSRRCKTPCPASTYPQASPRFSVRLTNGFLPALVNARSYNLHLLATPYPVEPRGYTFGHLALLVLLQGKHIVAAPTFQIRPDSHAGLRLFTVEEGEALALMRRLASELQDDKAAARNPLESVRRAPSGSARHDNRILLDAQHLSTIPLTACCS